MCFDCCKKKGKQDAGMKPKKNEVSNTKTDGRQPMEARAKPKKTYTDALWNYTPGGKDELQLKKGDELVPAGSADKEDSWIRVMNVGDNRKGYVPAEWIGRKGSIKCEEWFYPYGYFKRDIEQLLQSKYLSEGAFAIRVRDETGRDFALIQRVGEPMGGKVNLRHLRIQLRNGKYKVGDKQFNSLQEFVQCHQKNAECTTVPLSQCPTRPAPRRKELSREMGAKFQINRADIQYKEQVGKGHYGQVYRAIWKQRGGQPVEVAVKEMKGSGIQAETFLAEAKIMKSLDHTNLVKLYGVCIEEDPILLLTEYMAEGSLSDYLKRRKKTDRCREPELFDILLQVAKAMEYLAENKLIHRDLAARNVLVGERHPGVFPVVKVADFGLARIMDSGGKEYRATTAVQLALKWMAPESFTHSVYTPASDVWSFGVLMFEVLSHGKKPYPGMDGRKVQKKLSTGWRMERDSPISDQMYQKMLACWSAETKDRPTFTELVVFFEDFKTEYTAGGPLSGEYI